MLKEANNQLLLLGPYQILMDSLNIDWVRLQS